MDEYRETNRLNWDSRVPVHVASRAYDWEGFVAGGSSLDPVEVEELGDVSGKRLLHLQCHFGRDTLSWARLGATVTGIDFSPAAIEAARRLSAESGVPGRFVEAELYDSPNILDERFDIVYTGIGALCWLPDIRGWAEVVARFLEPGGRLYLREGHPGLWALDDERDDRLLVTRYPYFETPEPQRWVTPNTYTDGPELEHPTTYEWNHGLGEIVTALIDAGLRLEFLHEHRFVDWQALPWMVRADPGRYRLPEGDERLPLMYSLRAVKEG
ncbi:MAG: methyltransferase domain-containing protein [Dehalococcoidia bacterium]|nr:methyltransferase domain-containing protein [Dehalococcoidia bacterium]